MSGLAAGIRLAHFGKKVCIFERHNAAGGLNSFYSQQGRKFDVGLHALTNFVRPGVKGTPLTKLLRQLRISRDEFQLCEQKRSRVCFGPTGDVSLGFTNDFEVFESEVASAFPAQIDGFRRLVAKVREYDDVSLDAKPVSAREVVREFISDALLEDMIFCPVMYYGSAREQDLLDEVAWVVAADGHHGEVVARCSRLVAKRKLRDLTDIQRRRRLISVVR